MIIIILIVILIIVCVIVSNNKKKKSIGVIDDASDDTSFHFDTKTPSKVHISDDFKSTESVTVVEKEHTITTIYKSKEDAFIWVCPRCEVENLSSKKKCCVCHYKKMEE